MIHKATLPNSKQRIIGCGASDQPSREIETVSMPLGPMFVDVCISTFGMTRCGWGHTMDAGEFCFTGRHELHDSIYVSGDSY